MGDRRGRFIRVGGLEMVFMLEIIKYQWVFIINLGCIFILFCNFLDILEKNLLERLKKKANNFFCTLYGLI